MRGDACWPELNRAHCLTKDYENVIMRMGGETMKHMICFLLIIILEFVSITAGFAEPYYWYAIGGHTSDYAQRYDASKVKFKGSIYWTIEGFWPGEPSLIKSISLSNGKIHEWSLEEGYIIQKNPDEFAGVLYAVENNPVVEIWHVDAGSTRTLIATYDIPLPYYERGMQTVRAYMNGALYYIKALEDTGIYYATKGSEIQVGVPRDRKAVLCRLDADGSEYEYQLNNYTPNALGACQSLLNAYAIAADGKAAWCELIPHRELYAQNIVVETPKQGTKQVFGEAERTELQCENIPSRYITWLDENTIMFAVDRFLADEHTHAIELYAMDVSSGEIISLTDAEGKQLCCYNEIVPGSNIVINRNRDLMIYMGLPNSSFPDSYGADLESSIPIVIDLKTGKSYACYQNKAKADDPVSLYEVRNNAGRFAYVEAD